MTFASAFGPENGTAYRISKSLATTFAGRAVVEGLKSVFDVEEYAAEGHCTAIVRAEPHPIINTNWTRAHGLRADVEVGIFDVTWEGLSLTVAHAEWLEGFRERECRWFVAAETKEIAERFAKAVCAFCNEPRRAVLAFRGGCWRKD